MPLWICTQSSRQPRSTATRPTTQSSPFS